MSWSDYIDQKRYVQYQQSIENRNRQISQDCLNWNAQNPTAIFYKSPIYIEPNARDYNEWLKNKL